MTDNSSAASIAINILGAPREALPALAAQPRFLLPLAILLGLAGTAFFIYMNNVDVAWFFERIFTQDPRVTDVQAAELASTIAGVPQAGLAALITVFVLIWALIMLLLQALYLKVFSWITKDGISYRLWFGIACFCALPTALRSLASIANLLVSDVSLLPPEQINPLAFARLFGIEPGGHLFENIVLNLDLMTVWSLALLVLAVHVIGRKSVAASVAIVATPLALVVGLWLVT